MGKDREKERIKERIIMQQKLSPKSRVAYSPMCHSANHLLSDYKNNHHVSDRQTDFIRSEVSLRSLESDDDGPILINTGVALGTAQSRSIVVSSDRGINPVSGNRVGGVILGNGCEVHGGDGSGSKGNILGCGGIAELKNGREHTKEKETIKRNIDLSLNLNLNVNLDLNSNLNLNTTNNEINENFFTSHEYLSSKLELETEFPNDNKILENLTGFEGPSRVTKANNPNISSDSQHSPKFSGIKPAKLYDILVVDDSKLNRKMLCKVLRSEGHMCDEAEDGIHAIEKVRMRMNNWKLNSNANVTSNGNGNGNINDDITNDVNVKSDDNSEGHRKLHFDAILMDFVMPNMDGPTGDI